MAFDGPTHLCDAVPQSGGGPTEVDADFGAHDGLIEVELLEIFR